MEVLNSRNIKLLSLIQLSVKVGILDRNVRYLTTITNAKVCEDDIFVTVFCKNY